MKQSKFMLTKILTTVFLCLLLMSFTANSAFATNTWIGGVGYWNVPTNWSSGIPNDTEDAKIVTEGDICTVYTNVPAMISYKIAIARDATLVIDTGGYLKSGKELKVGDASASGVGSDIGYLILKGGQLDISGTGKLEIGYKATGDGTFTISGGSLTGATGRLYVGGASAAGAKGKVTIQGSAATISQQDLYVGASSAGGSNPGDGTLEFQIGSAGVSPIVLSGTAYLDPAGALSTARLVLSLTATPPPEQDILLISGPVTGTFDTVNGAPAPEGTLVVLNYGGNGYCYRLTYAGSVVLKWAPAAVSFSVNGPVDPHYDGIWYVNGPMFWAPWWPPPTPVGAGPFPPIRLPAVTQAVGIPTFRPGDVFDYAFAGVPSEAEIFQSEPDTSAGGASNKPNGTNNQILQAVAMGLRHGQDNINAYTFGEDFFNGDEQPENTPPFVDTEEWEYRPPTGYIEPVVGGGGLPIKFYFSVDPWAVGLAGTSVRNEATLGGTLTLPVGPTGAADVDWNPPPPPNPPYGQGPWASDGEASGDVFSSEPITIAGTNIQVHDEAILALLGPRPTADIPDMEDDLDALETVGTNTLYDGTAAEPGNTHDRVAPTLGVNGGVHPPDLGDPYNPNHDPINGNPIIFSVDRGSYGAPGSAVQAQVMNGNEGASGDLFIAVHIWDMMAMEYTTNMLLIDEGQLGLMPHDDLDAVIVKLLIDLEDLEMRIEDAAWNFDEMMGSYGYGFTIPLLNPGEAVVGFSVDTSSVGVFPSAVDFESRMDGSGQGGCNPPASGVMEQAGDIFYANLIPIGPGADWGTGIPLSTNYLWFEERRLGLDRGTWSLPRFPAQNAGDLGELPDELNALDSLIGRPKPTAEHLKWSQPPIEIDPSWEIPTYSGWDELSHREEIEPELWRVVADDFRCLGNMPITSIHWWGSHFDYEWSWGQGILPPVMPIAWKIGFWSNVPAIPGIEPEYSYPEELLWLIEVPASRVYWEEAGKDEYHGWFPYDICYQYYLELEPNEWFWQGDFEPNTLDNVFWLSIAAIYDPCETPPYYPWGWKTRPLWLWHWMDDAVRFWLDEPFEPGLVLDPINNDITPIEDPKYYESVDVAFELDTDPCYIKWEQPFTGIRDWPHYEDIPSDVAVWPEGLDWLQAVADDWPCKGPLPVTAIVWWGSYLEYYFQPCSGDFMPMPDPPDYFWISIWTDVPDPDPCDPQNWSQPGDMIWDYNAYDYDEVLVGYDKDPRVTTEPPREAVFRYSVRIDDPNDWFWQDPNDSIYWLMIVAAYKERYPDPDYIWGWTLHKHVFHDDAVIGHPIIDDGEDWEWYEIYDETGVTADMSFILFTDPNAEPPEPPEIDFGDANDPPYPTLFVSDGARHVIGGSLWLGPADDGPDSEGDGQPDPQALGDDNDGNDDEDGVTIPVLIQGVPTTITVEVYEPSGIGGFVELWIDFDGNGSWNDPGELVFSGVLPTGTNPVLVTAPIGSVVGQTFARCRISSQGTGGPTGLANDGEVEDHKVTIEAGTDFGDAPDPTYPTLLPLGARHTIVPGVMLGAIIDAELDGQPNATATGDDNDGNDDEDGVVFTSLLVPGQQATVDVTASVPGMLNAWIDFHGDGEWSDTIDQIFNNVALTGFGVTDSLVFTVPGSAVGNIDTFSRFRFDIAGGLSYDGPATNGEVEDYIVHIEHKIKWTQPPEEIGPGEYYGWDEPSIYGWMQIVADDWPCEDQRPVTDVHWWGSYYDWEGPEPPPPPFAPIGFHIGIWTDVPAGVDQLWSHPGIMIWEYYAIGEVYEEFAGVDYHPEHLPETCFKYNLQLPEENWFWQDPNSNSIYWISIAALYEQIPEMWYWGWKTRLRDPGSLAPDDAVRIWFPTAPVIGQPFEAGEPIENQEGSWDMAFELTTQECLIGGNAGSLEYSDWATWGYPKCWCYPRQCRGDVNGKRTTARWVQTADLGIFRSAFYKSDAVLRTVPNGICADLNHKRTTARRVQASDLNIFRTYFFKPDASVPVCDTYWIYTGPYNFWTSP